ncbi:MAG: DUF883 family protein [Spirochaetes bacterium]|jgi:ElaB/YqjD/DUF883 family membrane-anchored ribosome-binding protein|nr:DUF883 family protein [Spirochaetota bacterium]
MSDIKKSKKQLQDSLKKLVADTKELLGSTANVSDSAAKAARAQVEESLNIVQNHVSSGISDVEGRFEDQLHELDQHVKANPYKTMGICCGVGLLLGFLIGRK